MKMRSLSVVAVAVFVGGMVQAAIVFDVKTDHPDAMYKCGEKAVFTVTAKDDKGAPLKGAFTARLDNFGPKVIATTEVDLEKSNVFTLEGTLAEPGFLRVHVDGVHQPVERHQLDYSVAFEPEKIVPAAPAPKDFLSFWLKAKDRLDAEVPLDPQVERVPAKCTDKYDYYKLSFATFGRRIYGLMTVPTDKRRAPYPVRVEVPGAGCGLWALKIKPAPDAICCFLAVNNFEPDEDDLKGAKEKWDAINAMYREKYGTQEYSPAGLCESREEAYFYPVILGINRAIDWLARRDDINRNSFTYQGTSQGGGMGIILTALNRDFTHASFFVPALTDMLGYQAGRASGWPYPPIVDWYKSVVGRLGSQEKADEFMRFYLLPGRAHGGGSGVQDLNGRNEALIDWVEKGVAPASLEGRLKDGGTHSIAAASRSHFESLTDGCLYDNICVERISA